MDKILADENYWDQNAFNDLMIRGAVFEPRRKDRLFMCASYSCPAVRGCRHVHVETIAGPYRSIL